MKTKIGIEEAHVTRDSDTTFKVNRFKVNLQGRGILWWPPAQLVIEANVEQCTGVNELEVNSCVQSVGAE